MATRTLLLLAAILTTVPAIVPAIASAQELSASERDAGLARVRSLAACVQRHHEELQRVLTLLRDSEAQGERARDEAVRRDAERAVDALIARAAGIQRNARACVSAPSMPEPGPEVVVEDPPPDAAADAVAGTGHSLRTVEADAELASHVRVVRGEQVDGTGRVELSDVRAAVRGIAAQLQRCYESHLARGSAARELDLVFSLRAAGRADGVDVEGSGASHAPLEECVRLAGRSLRISRGPSGGEAVFSYRLRFGR